MRKWTEVPGDEQLRLREAYQRELDRAPATCSLDEKVTRFAAWLAARDIAFSAEDISRKTR
ncbi:MAG: hypothetical protein ACU0CY_11285 [Maritimibacter harenae]